jgi:membrane protease YdiL (CAAX protease family)
MFLGYLYFVSGSIWLPVAAHFTNNFLQVLLKYLFQLKIMNVDLTESSFPLYISIASTIIFFTCIYIFHLWKLNPVFDEPAEQTETETQTIAE